MSDFNLLPPDAMQLVFKSLDTLSLRKAAQVSRSFRENADIVISSEDRKSVWKRKVKESLQPITESALQRLQSDGNKFTSARIMESDISNCDPDIQPAVLKGIKSHSNSTIREMALLCELRANPIQRNIQDITADIIQSSVNKFASARIMESHISRLDPDIQTEVREGLKSHSVPHIVDIALLCEQRANTIQRNIQNITAEILQSSVNKFASARIMESHISRLDPDIQTEVLEGLKSPSVPHIREIALLCEQRANTR